LLEQCQFAPREDIDARQIDQLRTSVRQTEDLDPSVLPEMTIEGERHPHPPRVEHWEGDRITQHPIFVGVRAGWHARRFPRSNPRERRASPIEQIVFLPGTRRLPPAPAGADQTEHRMIGRKRRDSSAPPETRAHLDGRGRHETASGAANGWQLTSLNHAPHRRSRDAQNPAGFFD
jgi:hypothetical protein